MREALDRWVAAAILVLSLTAAALRMARRSAHRRRVRHRHGAY